jgi:hypothetical protein
MHWLGMDALFHERERVSGWRFFVSVGWCLGPASVLGINLKARVVYGGGLGGLELLSAHVHQYQKVKNFTLRALVHGLRA